MRAPASRSGFGRGLLGAFLGLPIWLIFCLGFSVRACLTVRPGFLWLVTFELFLSLLDHFAISLAAVIAGFVIGYFIRLKPLLVLALLLAVAAFAVGYAVGSGGCVSFI